MTTDNIKKDRKGLFEAFVEVSNQITDSKIYKDWANDELNVDYSNDVDSFLDAFATLDYIMNETSPLSEIEKKELGYKSVRIKATL